MILISHILLSLIQCFYYVVMLIIIWFSIVILFLFRMLSHAIGVFFLRLTEIARLGGGGWESGSVGDGIRIGIGLGFGFGIGGFLWFGLIRFVILIVGYLGQLYESYFTINCYSKPNFYSSTPH